MSDPAKYVEDVSETDQDERLALSAIAAIQRLVEERNVLRSALEAKDQELARLRRNLRNVRETYRKLTCDFVRQLQYIDGAIGDKPVDAESRKGRTPTEGSSF